MSLLPVNGGGNIVPFCQTCALDQILYCLMETKSINPPQSNFISFSFGFYWHISRCFFPILFNLKQHILSWTLMNSKIPFYFMPMFTIKFFKKRILHYLHSSSHPSHQPNCTLASTEPHFMDTIGVKISSDEIQWLCLALNLLPHLTAFDIANHPILLKTLSISDHLTIKIETYSNDWNSKGEGNIRPKKLCHRKYNRAAQGLASGNRKLSVTNKVLTNNSRVPAIFQALLGVQWPSSRQKRQGPCLERLYNLVGKAYITR